MTCKFSHMVGLKIKGAIQRMQGRMRQLGMIRTEELCTKRRGKGGDKRNTTFSHLLSLTGCVFAIEKCLEMLPNNLLAK